MDRIYWTALGRPLQALSFACALLVAAFVAVLVLLLKMPLFEATVLSVGSVVAAIMLLVASYGADRRAMDRRSLLGSILCAVGLHRMDWGAPRPIATERKGNASWEVFVKPGRCRRCKKRKSQELSGSKSRTVF